MTEEQYHEGIPVEMLTQITLRTRGDIPVAVSVSEESSRTDQSTATKALLVPLHPYTPQQLTLSQILTN